jgi:DNA-directed RNA polymerase omega subunit
MTTPTSKIPERLDSKFRFVLVAAERAEQLMQGARPRLESTTGKKPTRIAQEEVRRELVAWDYGTEVEEEAPAVEEETEEVAAESEDEIH